LRAGLNFNKKYYLILIKKILSLLLLLFCIIITNANNLEINNLELIDIEYLVFDLSWENSWNLDSEAPANHDGVWIFAKIKINNNWEHLFLDANDIDSETTSSNLELIFTETGTGFLAKSTILGAKDIYKEQIQIKLKDPLTSLNNIEIQVFGIEMVYINPGPYFLGDAVSQNSFYDSSTQESYFVFDESAIEQEDSLRFLGGESLLTLPDEFPKGTKGFYCMKYEIGQQQFVDFINTLTYKQQLDKVNIGLDEEIGKRVMSKFNRCGIVFSKNSFSENNPAQFACDLNENGLFNEPDDGQNIACNFLNGANVRAYLDWAALRPMTELEFEKIARGPANSFPKEYVWGDSSLFTIKKLLNKDQMNETFSDPLPYNRGVANYNYSSILGPVRSGFAANDGSDRKSSGAGYFGTMEMTGNVWEYCISTDSIGSMFQGNLGDGMLDESGKSNESTWSNDDSKGNILRGGGWNSGNFEGFSDGAISDRYYYQFIVDKKRNTTGGRGVLSF